MPAAGNAQRPPRAPPVPAPIGRLLEPLYAAAVRRRNAAFDAGRGVVRLPIPVVSVGNLSVGGTGKTPMVAHLIGALRARAVRPCIAMRGYGGRAGGERGRDSDEAAMYRRLLGDLPVVARPDRAAGLRDLLASPEGRDIDCVVLDDGFQHRRLARDLDIVLIDAARSPFDDRLLPAGWLREPVASLRRADAVVITHAESADGPALQRLSEQVERAHGRPPVARMRHAWSELRIDRAGVESVEPVGWLAGKRVVAACAIGHPGSFIRAAEEATGGELVGRVVLPDHDPYRPSTVRRIVGLARRTGVEAILTTDKDWSKLGRLPAATWPCPVVRPRLSLAFERGEEELLGAVLRAVAGEPAPARP